MKTRGQRVAGTALAAILAAASVVAPIQAPRITGQISGTAKDETVRSSLVTGNFNLPGDFVLPRRAQFGAKLRF